MRIMVVGATGTIGKAIVENLGLHHTVIKVGNTKGDHHVDINSSQSIKDLFKAVGKVDAIVSATGNLHFGPLAEMTAEDFNLGLQDKLLGQVNLVLIGQHYLNDGGSITLNSGIVSAYPIIGGVNATSVNAAIEGFVLGASIELKDGQRINAVCPSVVTESLDTYGAFFPGYESVPVSRVANAYQRSVEGPLTGQVFKVW
ncbi:short chain dehydrogenase [Vibrio kasasachensis]|uniref:short chain dehydrogenase n=1 Tax=Vibrio kasasachensis TaxID=2910248 RepID=UPI003D0B7AA8